MRGSAIKNVLLGKTSRSRTADLDPILPWHPQIEDGEDFSFWLHRLAAGYGLSKAEFCKVFPGIDHDPMFAATSTGISANRLIDGTIDSFTALFLWKSSEWDPQIGPYYVAESCPWITSRKEGARFIHGGDFCPLCLEERPIFRLNWGVSIFVSCPQHKCLLSHLCRRCGGHFTGCRHLRLMDLSPGLEVVRKCRICDGNLSDGAPTGPVFPEVAPLELVHARLSKNFRCASYFFVLHGLLSAMSRNNVDSSSSRRLRAAIARPNCEWEEYPAGFERCKPVQRQFFLLALLDLFKEWPRKFVEVIRSSYVVLPEFGGSEALTWIRSAVTYKYSQARSSIDQVRDEFWTAAEDQGWSDAARLLYGERTP